MSYLDNLKRARHQLRLAAARAAVGEGDAERVVRQLAGLDDQAFADHLKSLPEMPAARAATVRAAVSEYLGGVFGIDGSAKG